MGERAKKLPNDSRLGRTIARSSTQLANVRKQPLDPRLDDYQFRLVETVRKLIDRNFYRKPPRIRILDAGCDTSGKQLWHFGGMTSGEVIGINVAHNFPSPSAKAFARDNIRLMNMDGMDLKFPDQSFDLVLSANVLEHIRDPAKYIHECSRVLRSSGIAYFETAPLWESPRGHHVHEDMVAENCPEETEYKNNGTIIPDWSHLHLQENEMRAILQDKLSRQACDYILWYLYQSGDLNKRPWSLIKRALESAFCHLSLNTWELDEFEPAQKREVLQSDTRVFGFSAVCRKRGQSPVSRRLIWRLRRLGL